MTGFIRLFDTARDYTLQFTITHAQLSTVTSSLAVAWYRLSTAGVSLPELSPGLGYQLLTATARND
jgi:hypothetical protein